MWQPPFGGWDGVDEVLASLGPKDVGTGMVTGADGRFAVDRLPGDLQVSSMLYAVAAGYATIGLRPGMREEVVIDLPPMGSLEVRNARLSPVDPDAFSVFAGAPPSMVTIEPVSPDATLATVYAEVDASVSVARVSHLAPGRWRVSFVGAQPQVVEVPAGGTKVVELTISPASEITGTVVGCTSGVLVLARVDGGEHRRFALKGGEFQGPLRPGRYRATVAFDANGDQTHETELAVPGEVELRAGESRLVIQGPLRGEKVQVVVAVAGRPYRTEGLGLVALDEPSRGSLIALFPDEERPGLHHGEAPAGRYALFDHGSLLTHDLRLPSTGPASVVADRSEVRVRFALPSALRPDESLRGWLSLVPQILSGDLAGRFRMGRRLKLSLTASAPGLTLDIVSSGRYLLTGETDLGPFEVPVDLTPGVEVTVPLGE